MIVTLYIPGQPPSNIPPVGFALPNPESGFAQVTDRIAQELGCATFLVDVLDCGPEFVAYTIFDNDGEVNTAGTLAVQSCSKHAAAYNTDDEDSIIRGPVLVVTK